MRTLFKSYGMYDLKELEQEEKYTREYLIQLAEDFGEEADLSDENVTDTIYDHIDMNYEDKVGNLNKVLEGKIIAIASVGTWRGTFSGYKILGNNLNEVITSSIGCDEKEIYDDGFNICAKGYHHDGRNSCEFRELREDTNYEVLLDKLYNQEPVSRKDINRYTKSLRKYVKEIYG